jgi:ABC-type antimicrobial peptide transport system permease subunit
MLYVEDPSRRAAVRDELQQAMAGFVYTDDPAAMQRAVAAAWTPLEYLANRALPGSGSFDGLLDRQIESRVPEFLVLSAAIALLFMSLPAINMTNLNIGRILERAPEIGLRKAAGASRRVLAGQFVFENVVLSVLGGLTSLVIALPLFGLLNDTLFTYGRLGLNWSVFAAAFAFVLVFGVLSGVYPAWKMAKLEPAVALRGSQHA